MIKRIFLKSLILLILVSLFKIHSTNAYFTNVAVSSENTFTVGDWTPPESELNWLDSYQDSNNFTLTYTAVDEISEVDRVLLYYRYQGGDWILTATDEEASDSFVFTAPDGDGEYEFFSIAIDVYGNIEDDIDEDGVLQDDELPFLGDTFTMVDTTPPVTMLSAPSYLAVANELLYNGGFENGNLDGWIGAGDGDHKVVDTDSKTASYSALIGFKTAASSAEPAFDSIKQNVSLPNWITSTLSFWYRLMTSDSDNVSGGFFDAFVTPTGFDPITVAHDGWDDPEVLDTDLGWKNVTYQLNELKGENIEVQFKVTQPYEDYQVWCYVDDVKLTAATNSATTNTQFSLISNDGAGANDLAINYSLDGVPQGIYTLPFTLSEGVHSFSYSSTDGAGNSETSKQATISATAAPVDFGVVLNEFLPDPAGDESATAPNGEWVELYNNSTNSANVDGWKMEDAGGNQMIISAVKTEGAGTVITAGGVLKVYRRGSAESSEPAFIMDNCDDTVKLLRPDDTQVDSYSYTFTIEGKSFARDPDGTGGWKDPEAEIPEVLEESAIEPTPTTSSIPETSPTPNPTVEPTSVPSTTPTPLPNPELFPTASPEPSPSPNPELTSTPAPTSIQSGPTSEPIPTLTPTPSPTSEL